MQSIDIAKRLEGFQTLDTVMKKLGIKRSTATKYIHELRKRGLVQTSGGGDQKRIYRISQVSLFKIGNPGMYDIINKYSRMKLVEPYEHRIIGRKLSIEEALVRAIASKEFRTILAALELFNHISNWPRLYKYAKENDCRSKAVALYEVARMFIRVKHMGEKTKNALAAAKDHNPYIIENMKSDDFFEIEKKYGAFIPFNRADLMRLRE